MLINVFYGYIYEMSGKQQKKIIVYKKQMRK